MLNYLALGKTIVLGGGILFGLRNLLRSRRQTQMSAALGFAPRQHAKALEERAELVVRMHERMRESVRDGLCKRAHDIFLDMNRAMGHMDVHLVSLKVGTEKEVAEGTAQITKEQRNETDRLLEEMLRSTNELFTENCRPVRHGGQISPGERQRQRIRKKKSRFVIYKPQKPMKD